MKKASNTNMTGNGLIGAWTPLVGSVNLHTTSIRWKNCKCVSLTNFLLFYTHLKYLC